LLARLALPPLGTKTSTPTGRWGAANLSAKPKVRRPPQARRGEAASILYYLMKAGVFIPARTKIFPTIWDDFLKIYFFLGRFSKWGSEGGDFFFGISGKYTPLRYAMIFDNYPPSSNV